MACRVEITLPVEDAAFVPAAQTALDEIDRLEDTLSVFRTMSAISELNRRAASEPVFVSREVTDLLVECERCYTTTDGAFDPTSGPLSRCWGFLRRAGWVPDADAIEAAQRAVGFDAVRVDREAGCVRFTRAGTELNLGAIGKGYALDSAGQGLRASGVRHALLSAGSSSVLAIGGRCPGWRVDLVSPRRPGRPIAELMLRDAALGTSGAGEQFFFAGGRRFGHVIDPRTGWPARGILSATVVAEGAARADALSTAFFVGGLDLAKRYCAGHEQVLALLTPDDESGRPVVVGRHSGVRLAVC
jgi:thiamine biosynthesis lipoprotein